MPAPTPDLKTMRNATAKKVMSQEGVDPDQDLDVDSDADQGSDADLTPDRDLASLRKKAAKKALGGKETAQEEKDTGETGSDTNWPVGLDTGDTGDTGEVGDRFGGTFGAERVEAVAVGEDWSQDVTDAVHGMRENLQHQDPGDEGGDYELVEAVGNPPTEIIFEGPDGQQYSVEYSTAHTEELSSLEQRTPYGGKPHDSEELRELRGPMIPEWQEELQDVSQQWLDTGDTGE